MTTATEMGATAPAQSVLFLDIDGVLNDKPYFIGNPKRHAEHGIYGDIDPLKIALLNEVVKRSGCTIVMSSSWRSDSKFRALFRRRGAKVEFHRDWRTGRISDSEPHLRGREIAEWLSRNPVERYAIVDDDSDMLPEQKDRFVQTSFETGMTREHAEQLITLLQMSENSPCCLNLVRQTASTLDLASYEAQPA